ncbi:transporter [Subtercola boreus]|uniref:Transporter n=1 Tax=Subtercola boreus TaxID=120213 RepID=A0A3E0W4M3_9MICO|nr:sugar ABC transporter permease [Subtercola boreus]RFA16735.1 transporter [Subtercola boreus]
MTTLTAKPPLGAPLPPAARPKPQKTRSIASSRRLSLTVMTSPAVIWFLAFMIVPAISIFVVSLLDWQGLLAKSHFAGLENYQKMLRDPVFWSAVRNTAVHVGVVLAIMIPVSFMLGYYLNTKPRGHRALRVLFFTPALLSISARAMVFFGVFAPGGLVNGVLRAVGLGDIATPWLADPSTSLGVVIFIDLWAGIGFTAILFAARLTSVPTEIYEAAELDGASHWRKMWQVAFPIIKGYVGVVTMLQFLWTLFNSATTVLLLTKGGPGSSSTTLSFMVYNEAFIQSDIGYSQAIGVVLFVVGLVGMLIISRLIRQNY